MKQLVLLDKVEGEEWLPFVCDHSRSVSFQNDGLGVSLPLPLSNGGISLWYYASHEIQILLRRSL